jgi:predicted metal-dependent phosphoesterase TrpH
VEQTVNLHERHLDADAAVDLHMHTIWSDGHWTPRTLFDHLAEAHFRLVAVTDHDRVDTAAELQALGAARGIAVIPGVEVTTAWRDGFTHLLCYGFDPARGALATLTQATRTGQLANARAVHAALQQQGYAFPRQGDILADKDGTITHPLDNVTLLREHGYAADFRAGVQMAEAAGHRTIAAPLADAVAAAHADGGIAIIAHPGRHNAGTTRYDLPMLDELRGDGIPVDGIEGFYPVHSAAQVRDYAAYAAQQGWVMSSGSDSHGPRQRLPIAYPAGQIAPLLARLGVTIA